MHREAQAPDDAPTAASSTRLARTAGKAKSTRQQSRRIETWQGKKPAPTDLAGILQRAGDVAGTALGSLLTRSALGFAIWDTDLRCIWVNDALEKYDGVPREQRLGRRPGTALPGDAGVLESAMREVLATGISDFPAASTAHPIMERAGGNRAFSVCAIRLDDAEGQRGVCQVVLEVTGRRWAEDRLALVSEAGARIGTTLDVMHTAQELADFTVPLLADYVTVDLT